MPVRTCATGADSEADQEVLSVQEAWETRTAVPEEDACSKMKVYH